MSAAIRNTLAREALRDLHVHIGVAVVAIDKATYPMHNTAERAELVSLAGQLEELRKDLTGLLDTPPQERKPTDAHLPS